MKFLTFKINPGQEVMEVLTKEFENRGLSKGAIVSVIGAVDHCCISNMPKEDAKKDVLTEYSEPFEMSGTGEIRDGKPHIHCSLSRIGDECLHGHLHWAKVENWYVSVYVMVE
jgi:predicted DNA-binding protein with PD1-like motif